MIQVSCQLGLDLGLIPPAIPFGTEFLFSVGTAILLHMGSVEPVGLKPSYLVFLQKLTGERSVKE